MYNWLSEFHLGVYLFVCSMSLVQHRHDTAYDVIVIFWRGGKHGGGVSPPCQHISSVSEHITDWYHWFVSERRRWPPLHIYIHFHSHFPSERRSVWRRSFVRCAVWESPPPPRGLIFHLKLQKIMPRWWRLEIVVLLHAGGIQTKMGFELVICGLVLLRKKKKFAHPLDCSSYIAGRFLSVLQRLNRSQK